jgi:hypothetical protein
MQFRTLNLIRAALSKILSEDFLKDGIKSYIHDKIVSGCIKSDALCLLGLIPKCLREHLAIQNLFPPVPDTPKHGRWNALTGCLEAYPRSFAQIRSSELQPAAFTFFTSSINGGTTSNRLPTTA